MLEAARTILAIIFLFYSSWSDYKTREVSNSVWVLFAPIALILMLTELFLYEPSQLLFYGFCFGLTAAFAIILFYSGGFGGADSKALMCLALALPFFPEKLFNPLLEGGISPISQILFPITIFSNSVLMAAATGIYMFLKNILWHKKTGRKLYEGTLEKESFAKKIVVLITSCRVSVAKLKEKWHVYPMEDIEETEGGTFRRKLVVIPKDEGRDAIVERLAAAVETGKINDPVWATPGLPMLIFITAGLLIALLFGDVIWILIRTLLS
jgi:preflagellin peptidase FlaK